MTAAVLQKTDVILFVTAKTVVMSKTVVRHWMSVYSYLLVLITAFMYPFLDIFSVLVYWLNVRLSGTRLCVWFWAWGEVWMDCPVRWRRVRVAETAERKHAPWQRAVLWLHLWHFHRYMMIQLTFLQEFFIFIKHFQIQW